MAICAEIKWLPFNRDDSCMGDVLQVFAQERPLHRASTPGDDQVDFFSLQRQNRMAA